MENRKEYNSRSMHSKRNHEKADVYRQKVFLKTTSINKKIYKRYHVK